MIKFVARYLGLCLCLLIAACQPPPVETTMLVYLQTGNVEKAYSVSEALTVEEFLSQPGVAVEWDDNDRLVPPPYTQITDGTRITIVRVDEDVDVGAKASQGLVDGVVDHFVNQVVQSRDTGGADVHGRAHADGF